MHAELEGTYLVRRSATKPTDFTLSVVFEAKVWHYRIQQLDRSVSTLPLHAVAPLSVSFILLPLILFSFGVQRPLQLLWLKFR